MKLSFKYRFILSFVTIEAVFIALIVFLNFSSLQNLSRSLIDEKIETGTKLFSELIKAPLAVYDLAMLDNAVESFTDVKNVVAVEIRDDKGLMVSHLHINKEVYKNILDDNIPEAEINGRIFRLAVLPVKLDSQVIGTAKIVFEVTDSVKAIQKNRELTFSLIAIEILLSIGAAYFIGGRLTHSLNQLTLWAEKMAREEHVNILSVGHPGGEIYVLSNTLQVMQDRIEKRNKNLKELVDKLQESTYLLQKQRDFHHALLDQASSVVVVMNKEGRIVLVNKAVEKLTGYKQEEVEGKIVWDIFIPKEIQSKVKEVFLSLVAGDFPSSYENEWVVKDGSYMPFAWSNSCIVDDEGIIEYVITVGIDMREKNKKEQTIKALLNSPMVSIILIDIDETIVEINDIAAKRLNKSVNELKGHKLYEFTADALSQTRGKYIDEILLTKQHVMFEYTQDNQTFKKHYYPIFDTHGNIVQISIFSHDITQVRRAEKELQKYIQLVDENVIMSHTDVNGITTSVSQAFCKLTGYSQEELIGKEYNIIRHPDMKDSLYTSLWKTISKGKVWKGEIKNQTKDGEAYWVETTIYPDIDENGAIIGYNAIRQDITNKKMIEQLSITDPLTQLYNRRHFDDVFNNELNRAKRERRIFCFMMLDVDHFKIYNDTYGHQEGDRILVKIADILNLNMRRAGDYAFRIGGEEFCIICTVKTSDEAQDMAQKIRTSVENKKIEHSKNDASPFVSVSIGVLAVDFSVEKNLQEDVMTIYKRTDQLLYNVKNSGRNSVEIETL